MSEHDPAEGLNPYRYLTYYDTEDAPLFFGRDKEIDTLVGDILTSRLVVLFAPSGTGKTSLINAGVRPRLEQYEYATVHCRVEHDPITALAEALHRQGLIARKSRSRNLTAITKSAVDRVKAPLVVFFDQFEEFIIQFVRVEDLEPAYEFIENVADVYSDEKSAVHIVFSMREEYFVDLDVFRSWIPSIFHSESTLRLRNLDRDQAKAAIVKPAAVFGVEVQPRLVSSVIDDLAQQGRVPPAPLQIVCDTLWRERGDGGMTVGQYRKLGTAERILDTRIVDGLRELDEASLLLLLELLPELRTPDDTKYTRAFAELVKLLGTDASALGRLVEQLGSQHLLREHTRNRTRYIEWTSDYVAAATDRLQTSVRGIELQRRLDTALDECRQQLQQRARDSQRKISTWTDATFADVVAVLELTSEDFEAITEGSALLHDLTGVEARLLLITALGLGAHVAAWFEHAESLGVSAAEVLREAIRYTDHSRHASNAVSAAPDLPQDQALALLEFALNEPAVDHLAVDALKRIATDDAVQIIAAAVPNELLTADAVDALRRIGTDAAVDALARSARDDAPHATRAGRALYALAAGDPASPATVRANTSLIALGVDEITALFMRALATGTDTAFWSERVRDLGVDPLSIVSRVIDDPNAKTTAVLNATRLLVGANDDRANEILDRALRRGALEPTATKEISARRSRETPRWVRRGAEAPRHFRLSNYSEGWGPLLRLIKEGELTPIIGAGATTLPSASEIARDWARRYDYPLSDCDRENLPQVAQYLAVTRDENWPRELLVEQLGSSVAPDFMDPNNPLSILASLPLSLYLTTNYDSHLTSALMRSGRYPVVDVMRWNERLLHDESILDIDTDYQPTSGRPLVLHLYGKLDVPESLVLTDEDFMDWLVASAHEGSLPNVVDKAIATGGLLAIGYSLDDWSYRALVNGLGLSGVGTVALHPGPDTRDRKSAVKYLTDLRRGSIYWGTSDDFLRELKMRWDAL